MFSQFVNRYFRGMSAMEKVAEFESLEKSIVSLRSELSDSIADLKESVPPSYGVMEAARDHDISMPADVGAILKGSADRGTASAQEISSHLDVIKKLSSELKKSEKSMTSLLSENPDMASIISDRLSDIAVEESFTIIAKAYASNDVTKDDLLKAYAVAMASVKLDVDLDAILDGVLTDKEIKE